MYSSRLTVMDHRKEAFYITQTVPAQLSVCCIRPWDLFALLHSERLQSPAAGMPELTSPCRIFHPITLAGPASQSLPSWFFAGASSNHS